MHCSSRPRLGDSSYMSIIIIIIIIVVVVIIIITARSTLQNAVFCSPVHPRTQNAQPARLVRVSSDLMASLEPLVSEPGEL